MSQQLYTTTELAAMGPEELATAVANNFVKPLDPVAAKAQERIGKAVFGEGYANPTSPALPPQDMTDPNVNPYAVTAWGQTEYDFRVPSGQLCRMKKLRPEELVGTDILDRITRLPALADEQVRKAQGQPPVSAMPDKESLEEVIRVMDQLIPMVVVQPKVSSVPKPDVHGEVPAKSPGTVYVDDIELHDRIAIMNRALQGVAKMDSFREEA